MKVKVSSRMKQDMNAWGSFLEFRGERPLLAAIRSASSMMEMDRVCSAHLPNVIRIGHPDIRSYIPQRNTLERSYVVMRREVLHKLDDCIFDAYRHKISHSDPSEWVKDWGRGWSHWWIQGYGHYITYREVGDLLSFLTSHMRSKIAPRLYAKDEKYAGFWKPQGLILSKSLEVHLPILKIANMSWMPLISKNVITTKTKLMFYEGCDQVGVLEVNPPWDEQHSLIPAYDSFKDFMVGYETTWYRSRAIGEEASAILSDIVIPPEHNIANLDFTL